MNSMPDSVELRGFEPLTFSLRTRRATNCAKAPSADNFSTAPHGLRGPQVWLGSRRGQGRGGDTSGSSHRARSDPGVEPHPGTPFVVVERLTGVDRPEVREAQHHHG